MNLTAKCRALSGLTMIERGPSFPLLFFCEGDSTHYLFVLSNLRYVSAPRHPHGSNDNALAATNQAPLGATTS